MTSGVVGKVLHFQQTNLVKTTSKYINNMTVVRNALRKSFVELNNDMAISNLVPLLTVYWHQEIFTLTAFL